MGIKGKEEVTDDGKIILAKSMRSICLFLDFLTLLNIWSLCDVNGEPGEQDGPSNLLELYDCINGRQICKNVYGSSFVCTRGTVFTSVSSANHDLWSWCKVPVSLPHHFIFNFWPLQGHKNCFWPFTRLQMTKAKSGIGHLLGDYSSSQVSSQILWMRTGG